MRKRLFPVITVLLIILLMAAFSAGRTYGSEKNTGSPPSGVRAASYECRKIRISWNVQESADGYAVYRASSANGKYKKVYSVKNPQKNWYINTGRIPGKTYYYKVRWFVMKNGKLHYSDYSQMVNTYARPRKVKNLKIGTAGFMNRFFYLEWDEVNGVDGYEVYIKDTQQGKWRLKTVVYEENAEIEIPDTSRYYEFKVRGFCFNPQRKKIKGYFSNAESYAFSWTADSLKSAGAEILKEKWPAVSLDCTGSDGAEKTPWSGTTWYAVWPLRCCMYEPWENVRKKLEARIDVSMEMGEGGLDQVCFFISPDSSPNWVEIYMIC